VCSSDLGPLGDGINIIALVGTVFGVATSMGIGVVLLSVGFSLIFGLEHGLGLQIALVIGAVVLTIAATTSGVDRGIRWISELNLWSAVAMMAYILFTGQTAFLMNALVENIGQFIVSFPDRKSTRLNSSHVKISYAVFSLLEIYTFPYTTLFRSAGHRRGGSDHRGHHFRRRPRHPLDLRVEPLERRGDDGLHSLHRTDGLPHECTRREHRPVHCLLPRSEEHTSELQSRENLVCRLLPPRDLHLSLHDALPICWSSARWF